MLTKIDITAEVLEDVIINLLNDQYSKRDKIEALAWGEKHPELLNKLFEKHQPRYFDAGAIRFGGNPIMKFTLVKELELNNPENK